MAKSFFLHRAQGRRCPQHHAADSRCGRSRDTEGAQNEDHRARLLGRAERRAAPAAGERAALRFGQALVHEPVHRASSP
eukprot:6138213-Pleurochrysis_carterae.AAC.2